MKSSKYIPVKISIQKILIIFLLIFSVAILFFVIKQKKDIDILKTKSSEQNITLRKFVSQVDDLENENSNLEDQINDLESRIDDLENRRIVVTYE